MKEYFKKRTRVDSEAVQEAQPSLQGPVAGF